MDDKEWFMSLLSRRDRSDSRLSERQLVRQQSFEQSQSEETSMERMLQDLYLDSQISSPCLDRRELSGLINDCSSSENSPTLKKTFLLPIAQEDSGDVEEFNDEGGCTEVVRPKTLGRSRKLGVCSENLLKVEEDISTKYMREYQQNMYGLQERKPLSPIVEKKLSVKEQVHPANEREKPKAECSTGQSGKKKISLGRLSKSSGKERSQDTERKSSRQSPNIEYMIKELFIKHQTEENQFKELDVQKVQRKISNEEQEMYNKGSPTEKLLGQKTSLFPFFQRVFPNKEMFKTSKLGRRTLSEGASEERMEIQLEGQSLGYDEVTGFWEDVCFTPRTDRRQQARRLSMRRNSSPDMLLNKLKKKLSSGLGSPKEKKDSPREKRSVSQTEKGERSGSRHSTPRSSRQSSRQSTPKLSRQSSRETPTPERKRSQAKRSVAGTSKPERKRSTPKMDRHRKISDGKDKKFLERTASTSELYRKSDSQVKERHRERTSSAPSLRRQKYKQSTISACHTPVTERRSVTPVTERRNTKSKTDLTNKAVYRRRKLSGKGGGSVDSYDLQDLECSSEFLLYVGILT